jgi:putative transposase
MAAPHHIEVTELLEQQLQGASPDLLRPMIASLANAMMSAQADQVCGAGYGERSDERVNRRNGYRAREWDTRAGTIELAIPKLREGSYFPDWLLTHRHRAEQALVTVVATAYLLGVSTRRVERLAEQLGVKSLSRSQVSEMATHLDAQVTAFRQRPLDTGPYTFVGVDALTVKVREDGRVVNVHALIATGVNADGHREILGLDVASAEDGAGWLAFLRGLVARGLSGVQLVISDARPPTPRPANTGTCRETRRRSTQPMPVSANRASAATPSSRRGAFSASSAAAHAGRRTWSRRSLCSSTPTDAKWKRLTGDS